MSVCKGIIRDGATGVEVEVGGGGGRVGGGDGGGSPPSRDVATKAGRVMGYQPPPPSNKNAIF